MAAIRRGDDRAFECLYGRYRRRIQAYAAGMCKDDARAEDITQEVFVAALRRMRETERPIAFKPWIYEIARNACIDHHRRASRAEEVSLQAEGGLAPADYGRLVTADPTPDAAVAVKQELEDLCGAFDALSDIHHDVLVMRELEGLSYRQIGARMGMTRPAVESTLFRARRRLTEEYDELASGRRCLRIQAVIGLAAVSNGNLGIRDARRLARHMAHCQPCRREAIAAGLDVAALVPPRRTSVAARVAALLPFPLLGRRGGGGDGWAAQLGSLSDHVGPGWAKAATAAAVLLAGAGAGVEAARDGTAGTPAPRAGAARTQTVSAPASGAGAAAPRAPAARALGVVPARRPAGDGSGLGAGGATGRAGAGRGMAGDPPGAAPPAGAVAPIASAAQPGGRAPGPGAPPLERAGTTGSTAQRAASDAAGAVSGAVTGATGAVSGAAGAVSGATGVVSGAVSGATGAVSGATGAVSGAAGAVSDAEGAAGGALGAAGNAAGALDGVATGLGGAIPPSAP